MCGKKKLYNEEPKKIEEGARTCEIEKLLNVSQSSERNIKKRKVEVEATLKVTLFFCVWMPVSIVCKQRPDQTKNKILTPGDTTDLSPGPGPNPSPISSLALVE